MGIVGVGEQRFQSLMIFCFMVSGFSYGDQWNLLSFFLTNGWLVAIYQGNAVYAYGIWLKVACK